MLEIKESINYEYCNMRTQFAFHSYCFNAMPWEVSGLKKKYFAFNTGFILFICFFATSTYPPPELSRIH